MFIVTYVRQVKCDHCDTDCCGYNRVIESGLKIFKYKSTLLWFFEEFRENEDVSIPVNKDNIDQFIAKKRFVIEYDDGTSVKYDIQKASKLCELHDTTFTRWT